MTNFTKQTYIASLKGCPPDLRSSVWCWIQQPANLWFKLHNNRSFSHLQYSRRNKLQLWKPKPCSVTNVRQFSVKIMVVYRAQRRGTIQPMTAQHTQSAEVTFCLTVKWTLFLHYFSITFPTIKTHNACLRKVLLFESNYGCYLKEFDLMSSLTLTEDKCTYLGYVRPQFAVIRHACSLNWSVHCNL